MSYTYASLEDLVATYERLKGLGIEPYWTIDHGPTTSLYYRDPDGNQVELQIDNFDSIEALHEYFRSGAFNENPIGTNIESTISSRASRAAADAHRPLRPRTARLTSDGSMATMSSRSTRPMSSKRPRPASRRRAQRFALADVRLLAPIPKPPKFLAIGFNYADHIAETGTRVADVPGVLQQAGVVRHRTVRPDRRARGVDARRLRRRARRRDRQDRCARSAPTTRHEFVAGYLIVDDVSVRDWQFKAPTMTLGKSFDTHGPIGPWLVTPDEIPDPHSLGIRTW